MKHVTLHILKMIYSVENTSTLRCYLFSLELEILLFPWTWTKAPEPDFRAFIFFYTNVLQAKASSPDTSTVLQ